jgi:hypothetical protein
VRDLNVLTVLVHVAHLACHIPTPRELIFSVGDSIGTFLRHFTQYPSMPYRVVRKF